MLYEGHVRFRGSPRELLDAAKGHVWALTLPLERDPDPAWRVATSVRDDQELQLRVVGPRPTPDARPVRPTLEEAYLFLMANVDPRGTP